MLPVWTPLFLLFLLILSCVWGMPLMLNKEALEGIFSHHESVKAQQCVAQLNPAVKNFLAWPNESFSQDQAVDEKEAKPEKVIEQEDSQKNKIEAPLNFQNIELQPTIELKVGKILEPNKESKIQENGKERKRRSPYQKFKRNVKDRKSRQSKPHQIDYKKKFTNNKDNPFFENVQQF